MVARVMFSNLTLFVFQRTLSNCPNEPDISSISRLEKHFFVSNDMMIDDILQIISAQQLPRFRDSEGREIIGKSIVDPFVEVSLHIPEWSISPFPSESATTAATSNAGTSSVSARTVSFRTTVVKDNGFNPVWRKDISIPFDCMGDMKDLIFVEIAVRQENKGLIGVHCTSLVCLEQGWFLIFLKFCSTNKIK